MENCPAVLLSADVSEIEVGWLVSIVAGDEVMNVVDSSVNDSVV